MATDAGMGRTMQRRNPYRMWPSSCERALAGWLLLAVVAAGLCLVDIHLAGAATGEDPDWPCVQRKVPEISSGQVWNGPRLQSADDSWRNDNALADLAHKLASRRTEISE